MRAKFKMSLTKGFQFGAQTPGKLDLVEYYKIDAMSDEAEKMIDSDEKCEKFVNALNKIRGFFDVKTDTH